MSQSLSRIYLHLVFSTKGRRRFLIEPVRGALHRYSSKLLENLGCHVVEINSVEDHVHVLFELPRTANVSEVVETLKKSTSKWIKSKPTIAPEFAWQGGYSVFSVSVSNLSAVKAYIAGQAEHHQRRSYEDELRLICKRHGVEMDERYVWD